jgi:hypothetical protein
MAAYEKDSGILRSINKHVYPQNQPGDLCGGRCGNLLAASSLIDLSQIRTSDMRVV